MSNSPFDPNSPLFPWYPPPMPPKPSSPLADLLADLPPPPQTKSFDLGGFLSSLPQVKTRPRIFVSYQHSSDQYYYNEFSRIFHDGYESVFDNSLRGSIRSNDSEYVIQQIRDKYITNTSCTIVLVGPTSYQRKYLDWEIKATLDKGHGLIGIQLPNVNPNYLNQVKVPERLNVNINSGYALWKGFSWRDLIANPPLLNQLVQIATDRDKKLISNWQEIKKQNG